MSDEDIRNPRRAPRVPLRAESRVEVRGSIWRVRLQDVGPGGCLIVPEEELVPRTVVNVLLVREDLEEPLPVMGRVAWTHGALTGIEFAAHAAPEVADWFERLLASRPALRDAMNRVPATLPVTATLVRVPFGDVRLPADEAAFLACVDDRSTIAAVLGRVPLPRERATAALFAVMQRGLIELPVLTSPRVVEPVEPVRPVAIEPVLATLPPVRAAPGSEISHGVTRAARPPAAQALLDASRDAASYGRLGPAIALASEALKYAPRDREIASVIVGLVRQGGARGAAEAA